MDELDGRFKSIQTRRGNDGFSSLTILNMKIVCRVFVNLYHVTVLNIVNEELRRGNNTCTPLSCQCQINWNKKATEPRYHDIIMVI